MLPHDLTLAAIALLLPLALVAFAAEAVIGFGAVVLIAAVGAALLPAPIVIPALVLLDLGLCGTLAIRHRHEIDWAFLLRRVLPAFLLGLPVGALTIGLVDPAHVRRSVGAAIAIAAGIELWRARSGTPSPRPPRSAELIALVAAGASQSGDHLD